MPTTPELRRSNSTSQVDATLSTRWSRFQASRPFSLIRIVARRSVFVLIFGFLAWQLTIIGWRDILAHLPTNPAFYLLFLAIYVQVSIGEMLAYRLCWRFDVRRSAPAFLTKRILNREVLGYSGELYFYTWAREAIALPAGRIAATIRDQNIISSVASNLVAVVLVLVYLHEGSTFAKQLILRSVSRFDNLWIGIASLLFVVTIALAFRFRRYLFAMPLGLALAVFCLHLVRLIIGQALQIWQWEVGVPQGVLEAWFTLSAASIIASRLPLIPSRDLLFVSAGVAMAESMQLEAAAMSSMLLTNAVLAKIVSAALFALLGSRRKQSGPTSSAKLEATTGDADPGGRVKQGDLDDSSA